MKYKFECGCEVEILDSQLKENDGLPSLFIDYYNLPDCPRVWELIGSGRTKGIFQLETNLGQAWAKRLMPESVSEMAALISIIRPGCLKALIDGKSITQHFIDRKHGLEEVEYFHEALEPILKETYSLLVYQEQAIRISQEIAGFSLSESDSLRKSIGKKLPELMSKVEIMFIEGCKKTQIVTEEQAREIFDWIRKAERYSFNKCLSLTTLVETKGKFKTLDEIIIGEYILAPNNNKDEYVEVVNKYNNEEKELYEITLESGRTIQCTLDHKFLCEDGEIIPLIEILEKNKKISCQDD